MAEILVLEDDTALGLLICDALRTAGHRAKLHTKVATALEHIETGTVDLAICDVLIRNEHGGTSPQGGITLMSRLYNAALLGKRRLPTIAMSGGFAVTPEIDTLKMAAQFGAATHVIQKPFEMDELTDLIEFALNEAET